MKRRGFHDDEERDLITAYESGEFRPVKDQQTAKQAAVQAVRHYLRKDARALTSASRAPTLRCSSGVPRKRGFRIRA